MEPLKPEDRARILAESAGATADDLEEYERLLAMRFMVDPNFPASPEVAEALANNQSRLAELRAKLFPRQPPAS